MPAAVVHCISIFPLIIPLRYRVTHAAAEHGVADPVVVAVELTGGTIGYGETVAQSYVTGESANTVVEAVRSVFAPLLVTFHPASFPEALEIIESLPWHDAKGCQIPAARAAVELALLDAAMRLFRRSMDDVVQWMELPGFGRPGSVGRIRFSHVLAAESTRETVRQLRFMFWYGLRGFKLKVGLAGDRDRLERVASYLGRALAKGRASLRIDANGRWTPDEAAAWLGEVEHLPIAAVEQPLPRGEEESLVALRDRSGIPIVADESLVTVEDARRLIEHGVADEFTIRLSKCGGLLPSLRIAALARRANVRIQLSGALGETSILAAAALRFLEVCPSVGWAEGCLGSFLSRDDIAAQFVRFRYGGRAPRLRGPGLGVEVEPGRLRRLCVDEPVILHL